MAIKWSRRKDSFGDGKSQYRYDDGKEYKWKIKWGFSGRWVLFQYDRNVEFESGPLVGQFEFLKDAKERVVKFYEDRNRSS